MFFYLFFPNFNFGVNSGPKMTKNYVCCTPYLSKHTSFDHVFCCTSLKWWHLQMLFQFFKILVFWVFREGPQKNGPKLQKKISHCISQELYLIWLWFLVHTCKMMISPAIFFHFFQHSDFSGFSNFISKCQKEILRCGPPSSRVCDFIHFFKILICRVAIEVKGQKIVQNYKKFCRSCSISQEPHIWLSFMVHICKMIISPGAFLVVFQNIDLLGCQEGWKGKKMPKMTIFFCLSGLIFQELYIIWSSYMVHMYL